MPLNCFRKHERSRLRTLQEILIGTAPGYGEVYDGPSFVRQSIHFREIVRLAVFPPCGVVSRATASEKEAASCNEQQKGLFHSVRSNMDVRHLFLTAKLSDAGGSARPHRRNHHPENHKLCRHNTSSPRNTSTARRRKERNRLLGMPVQSARKLLLRDVRKAAVNALRTIKYCAIAIIGKSENDLTV